MGYGRTSCGALAIGLIAGCGSNEPLPPAPDIERPVERGGSFLDSAVSGLEYETPTASGITGASGEFDFEPGETISFFFGGVSFGTAQPSAVATPLDLIAGDLQTDAVVNMVRFLLALDSDANDSNGIQLIDALRILAADWSVDFDVPVGAFDAEVADELAEASTVNEFPSVLPDPDSARMHLSRTVWCAYSGIFSGTSASTVTGTDGIDEEAVFTLIISEGGTGIYGQYSDTIGDDSGLINGDAITVDSARSFVIGDVANGGTFEGAFESAHWLTGTWDNPDDVESGTFEGARHGYQDDVVWRFTGASSGGDLFGIDVDADGNMTGAVMLQGDAALASATITGTVDIATGAFSGVAEGDEVTATLSGEVTLDEVGFLDGAYSGDGGDGTLTGNGCRVR
jgi:hypothetical protein